MKENYDELINQSHYRSGLWDAYWNVAKLFAIIAIPLLGWVIIAGIAKNAKRAIIIASNWSHCVKRINGNGKTANTITSCIRLN